MKSRTLASVLLVCLFPVSALAEFVGIPPGTFEPFYRRQNQPNWCWASSAAMVVSYQGVPLTQEQVVFYIKKQPVDQTAQMSEIAAAVNAVFDVPISGVPTYTVISGQVVQGAAFPLILYNQLKQKKPVIMTYNHAYGGHAVVVTGADAEFVNAPAGGKNLMINRIFVWDPFAYRQVGPNLVPDDSLRYREYKLWWNGFNLQIPGGDITGMILMNSSSTPH